LSELTKQLDKEGLSHTLFLSPKSESLHESIEKSLPADTTDLVAIGGDGTINACLNIIYDKNIALGIIPTGTGNDFIKTIDIGSDLESHIETIVNGKARRIDIGDCNGRKFINGVGIGFDGQIVYDNIYSKSLLTGHAKYYSHVLRILGSYRSRLFIFEIDEKPIEEQLIIMAIHNGTTFGGGFKLNPDGIIDDGFLNICTIGRIPGWKRFFKIGKLSFGQHGSMKEVKFYKGKRVTIASNPKSLKAHIDGEYLGEPPFQIKIIPDAIGILVR